MIFSIKSLLQINAISKSFPGVRALEKVAFHLNEGQIVAIVGENGAGKSTLMKILGGILTPDEGELIIDGQHSVMTAASDAMRLGIHLIHQELNLADDLSIAENIFLGRQPYRGSQWLPITSRKAIFARASAIMEKVGLSVSPRTQVIQLSIGQRQQVEIAKALSTDSRILIFDEPTSSLSLTESKRLLDLIAQLRKQGVAILYVTHRLEEVEQLADRVEVLRDGRHVGTLTGNSIKKSKMISMMVGRELEQFFQRVPHTDQTRRTVIEVRNLKYEKAAEPIHFEIQAGEIVGFAGLVGSGRTELAQALFGVESASDGEIRLDGKLMSIRNPFQAVSAGLALVPEDRQRHGLVLPLSVRDNVTLSVLGRLGTAGLRNRNAERLLALDLAKRTSLRAASIEQETRQLSGGNQQKVVLAKWLATEARLLILDEPTRGVDIGAKSEIYNLICSLASRGLGIMMISSDMEEIVGISDRVIVMHEGRITGQLGENEINEEAILALAVGATKSMPG